LRRLVCSLRASGGEALVEGVLALGLVLLVVALAMQALAYVHARSVAAAAAQDGARAAATGGANAGIARAEAILEVAGGAGAGLHASADENGDELTISVSGQAPRLFPLALLLPELRISASLPAERYPTLEAAP
jgi:hypothetical protein